MTTLGGTYRDRVSGFIGIATARAQYLTDSTKVLLEANVGPAGDEKSRWVAESRLEPCSHEQGVGFTDQ